MKLTKDYFKEQLKNGVTPEDLADNLAKMLNEAQDEYNAEVEKKTNKEKDLTHLVEEIKNYLTTYYDPKVLNKFSSTDKVDIKEIDEAIDSFMELASLDDFNFNIEKNEDTTSKSKSKDKDKDDHDIIIDCINNLFKDMPSFF